MEEADKRSVMPVEELQSCNIFPPQVTLAAYEMGQKTGHSKAGHAAVQHGRWNPASGRSCMSKKW